jgi:hypothetical protein
MSILHLCFDGHAISHTIPIFDKYYPNSNYWFISGSPDESKRLTKVEGENITWITPWTGDNYLNQVNNVVEKKDVSVIICHSVINYYIDVLRFLSVKKKYKVYWIFWGFELYWPLGYSGKKRLIDNSCILNPMTYVQPTKWAGLYWYNLRRHQSPDKIIVDFLKYADYFCFWLYDDYQMLQTYYPSPIKYKFFQYAARWKDNDDDYCMPGSFFCKKTRTIIVNHQASKTGNHITIMKKLKSLTGIDDYHIFSPLSYGARSIRRYVCWKGRKYFKGNFHALTDFVPRDDYYNLVGSAEIAIFGQLRQEAAGNIEFFLTNGTKVFMREDNVLYQHYKKQGYIIFSFEKDLNTIDDLVGLTMEEKEYNVKVHEANIIYYDDFMPCLLED